MAAGSVRILFGAWNVNGKPVKENLGPWLGPQEGFADVKPDMVVVGFQEFDLTPDAFVRVDEQRLRLWREAIEAVLKGYGQYVLVSHCQLVGMTVFVYSTIHFCQYISDVETAFVGCGYTGVMGNKGGVGVRMIIGGNGQPGTGRSIVFLNSHLNAHSHNIKRRQADFESICQRLVFFAASPVEVPPPDNLEAVRSMMQTEEENGSPPTHDLLTHDSSSELLGPEEPIQLPANEVDGLRLLDHDIVFWFGDLNYRIDLPRDEILKLIEEKQWDRLIAADQLTREMRGRRVFQGFRETLPHFLPTYKFDSGTDRYDSSEKKRLPAYCDRVLWRVSSGHEHHHHRFNGQGKRTEHTVVPLLEDDQLDYSGIDKALPKLTDADIKPIYYKSHMELKVSDHKPVSFLVEISLGKVLYSAELLLQQSKEKKCAQKLPVSSSSKRGYLTGIFLDNAQQLLSRYGPAIGLAIVAGALWFFWS